MRNIHDERFINELTSSLCIQSNYLFEMVDTVRKVLVEGSDRTDIFDVEELDNLAFDMTSHSMDWLSYEMFNFYFEYVGNDEYKYLAQRLTFIDDAFAIRVRVYKNGDLITDEFSKMSYITNFTVDHLAAYIRDLSKGLAR